MVAFEVPQYRWLWGSSAFSSMGVGVKMLAQGWLVLDITDSPFWVGVAAGLQGAGLVGFGVFGGVLVDRLDKRKVLISAHLANGTVALAVGLLVLFGRIDLWHVLVAGTMQGMLMAVQLPASNTMIYQTVGPHRLLNAMAARLLAFNLTRIVGSLIAGWLLSTVGIWSCYLFTAWSTYQAVVMLLFLRGSYRSVSTSEPFWRVAGEGIKYAWRRGPIRMLLLMSLLMELFGFSYMIMLPVMARDVLEVGASGLGFLSAAGGAGAVVSTIAVAGLGDFKNKGGLLVATAATTGLSVILFGLSPWYVVSLGLVAVVGGALMSYDVTMGTLLQLLSSDAVRGRVMGLYGLTFGFTSVGGFLAGTIATVISVPFAISVGGGAILAHLLGTGASLVRIRAADNTGSQGDDLGLVDESSPPASVMDRPPQK